MFLGEYKHTLDVKSRLVLPARFREGLGERFVIAKGINGCLFVLTTEEFQKISDKIMSKPMTNPEITRFARIFFGGAREAEPDSQGRVQLSAEQIEYAGIKKEVLSMGISNRIEIWSKESWASYNSGESYTENDLAQTIAKYMQLLEI